MLGAYIAKRARVLTKDDGDEVNDVVGKLGDVFQIV